MSELEAYLSAIYLLLGTLYICLIAINSEDGPLITALGMFAAFTFGPFLTFVAVVFAVPIIILLGPFYLLAKLAFWLKKT